MKCNVLLGGLLAVVLTPFIQAEVVMRISKEAPVSIVVPKEASPAETTAASELKAYLAKMTGAECPITTEPVSPAIHVGPTALAREAISDYDQLGREEWVLKSHKGNMVLAGGRPRGTLYAVYEYLEMLGVVWPAPGLEYVPKLETISVAPLDIRDQPAIKGRSIYTAVPMNSLDGILYQVRNKMNSNIRIPLELGGMDNIGKPAGCHTFRLYAKSDWPDEWFSMNDNGKRVRCDVAKPSTQLCLTNPDLRKAMVARLKEFIAEDRKTFPPEQWPRIYDISHNDCHGECHCPECKALAEREGSFSGPMIEFINAIAEGIAPDYPEIMVQTFAYTWTLDAPKNIRPAKNVLMRVCKLGCEFYPGGKADTQFPNTHPRNQDYYDNFRKWAAISENLAVWDYWIIYRYLYQPPYLNSRNFQLDARIYRDSHVKTIFAENESNLDTSFAQFKHWFGLKMFQNPDLDYDDLADRFCKAYYGPAAKPMREYMDYLQQREIAADAPLGRCATFSHATADEKDAAKIEAPLPYLDRAFYEKANAFLDEAENLCQGRPELINNVRRERIPVDITLINHFAKYPTNPPTGQLVEPTLEALFNRYRDNYLANVRYYYANKVFANMPERVKHVEERLELNRRSLLGKEEFLPEKYRGRHAIEFNWSMFKERELINDADAYMGHAKKLSPSQSQDYHKLPFKMGLYCKDSNKFITNYSIAEADIPQDEKYHWYDLGRFEILPNTYLWLHWTWRLQHYVDSVYIKDGDNFWNVSVSVKLTGEPYVKGSTSEPQVLVDRIVLTK